MLLLALPALCQAADDTTLCDHAIAIAEAEQHLPQGLLGRIARIESGRPLPRGTTPWPWTIDADGQGRFLASKADAIAVTRAVLAAGATFVDVGCLQIDLAEHKDAFASLDEAYDPLANARYAARFLRALYAESTDWNTATGDYHSRTPELAMAYRDRVAGGAGAGYGRMVGRPGHLFGWMNLALAGGGRLTLNVQRQPRLVHRALTPCQLGVLLQVRVKARCTGDKTGLRKQK